MSLKYRPEVDGLRALAVIPVVLFHAGIDFFKGGFVGVDIFFVISGYLITSIIISELDQNRFSLIQFYERRARRILPMLFFVLACSLPFAWVYMLPSELKAFSNALVAVILFTSNILFWRDSGYFEVENNLKPLLHTWSLSVEEQYYLLFPVFLMIFWYLGKRKIAWMLSILALISLVLASWGIPNKTNLAFYLLPFRAWELLAGALAAFYLLNKKQSIIKDTFFNQLLSIIGFGLILYSITNTSEEVNAIRVYALVPIIGTLLIIMFASKNTFVGKVLSSTPFVGIGLISYSAYLWHQPIFAFTRLASPTPLSGKTYFLLSVFVFILAYFSWKWIETPFRDKNKFNQQAIFKFALIGCAIYLVIGLIGVVTHGFVSRYPEKDRMLATLNVKESGMYVEKRFNALALKPFDSNNKKTKVLVIGDSFAQDLVNAIYEVQLDSAYEVSTRHISHNCGNLFLPFDRFKKNIAPKNLFFCNKTKLDKDEQLIELVKNADEIWLSSAWQPWQVDLLPLSINSIQTLNKNIRVFGVKSFGKINVKTMLALSPEERRVLKNEVSEISVITNTMLRKRLDPKMFVDLTDLLCNQSKTTCSIYTPNGELISYDGDHLTPAGALFMGQILKESIFAGR